MSAGIPNPCGYTNQPARTHAGPEQPLRRGDLSVPDLRALLEPHVHAYRDLVLQDIVDPGMNVKKTMNI